ncbi:unnamed protein product [Sphagnum balticum]
MNGNICAVHIVGAPNAHAHVVRVAGGEPRTYDCPRGFVTDRPPGPWPKQPDTLFVFMGVDEAADGYCPFPASGINSAPLSLGHDSFDSRQMYCNPSNRCLELGGSFGLDAFVVRLRSRVSNVPNVNVVVSELTSLAIIDEGMTSRYTIAEPLVFTSVTFMVTTRLTRNVPKHCAPPAGKVSVFGPVNNEASRGRVESTSPVVLLIRSTVHVRIIPTRDCLCSRLQYSNRLCCGRAPTTCRTCSFVQLKRTVIGQRVRLDSLPLVAFINAGHLLQSVHGIAVAFHRRAIAKVNR